MKKEKPSLLSNSAVGTHDFRLKSPHLPAFVPLSTFPLATKQHAILIFDDNHPSVQVNLE